MTKNDNSNWQIYIIQTKQKKTAKIHNKEKGSRKKSEKLIINKKI